MDINADFLRAVAPHCSGDKAIKQAAIIAATGPILEQVLAKYEMTLDTPVRIAHFIGQTMEEAAGYCTLREFASGREYEGRHDLGNTQPGDGVRYAGRSPLQLTGRANYDRVGKELGLPLVDHPEMAEQMPYALEISCAYWRDHRINALADLDDIEHVTRAINGGWNGIAQRISYTDKAKHALGLPVVSYSLSARAQQAVKTGH